MPESGPRVVLLARAGAARDRVRSGLVEAGADLVLEADPTGVEPPQLHEARPQLAMVVLDAFTEPAFDRLEPVLAELGAEVMLEEADVAAAREGWDAARWVRHLAAKLHRHGDVLPPGAEPRAPDVDATPAGLEKPSDAAPDVSDSPASPDSQAFDLSLAPVQPDVDPVGTAAPSDAAADEASAAAEAPAIVDPPVFDLSLDPALLDVDAIRGSDAAADGDAGFDVFADVALLDPALLDASALDSASPGADDALADGLSFDTSVFDAAAIEDHASSAPDDDAVLLPFPGAPADPPPDAGGGIYMSFDPVAAESPGPSDVGTVIAFDVSLDDGFTLPDGPTGDASAVFDPAVHGDLEFATPPPGPDALPAASWEDAPADVAVAEPVGGNSRFGALELALDDGPIVQAASPATSNLRHLEDLDRRIASLELVDDAAIEGRAALHGAVAVLAGIGGPDAVRQLLNALPPEFARPVLVQQRLDGARHDRLVAQMQRASALPVELATAAAPVNGGVVYIVPAGIGLARTADGLRFDDSGELLAALEPAGSAVVLLSGTELADAERLAAPEWAPALRAAQAPEGCYDATAPLALASLGGISGQPAELARHLIERWSAP